MHGHPGLLILPGSLPDIFPSFHLSINIFITHIVLTALVPEYLLFDSHSCSHCSANVQNKPKRQVHRTNFADVS
jgi:hypothetical protein